MRREHFAESAIPLEAMDRFRINYILHSNAAFLTWA